MHLRRALLLFALVLGLTALATAVAPTPKSADNSTVEAPPDRPALPPPTVVTFQAPAKHGHVPHRTISATANVIVQVESAQGGEASIPGLAQLGTVAVGAPAVFNLLDVNPGTYDVMFQPALGTPARVGRLVSKN
jgi:hypothetical protein